MSKEIIDTIIKRANLLAKQDACMGSGWDEDNPMTELAEALTYLISDDEALSEFDSSEIYDAINSKFIQDE